VSILALIFSNKLVLEIGAAIAALLGIYLRGYFQGKSVKTAEEAQAANQLAQEVIQTENKNIEVDQKRQSDVQNIDTANSVDSLIKLWSDVTKKTDSDSSKKNP
jgi:F0F1-type ATP synthase membrane subunit c/vacuolar-type H+-ATPase subunit K